MNTLRKKAAVEKYKVVAANGASAEELKEAIAQDEKGYTPEEVTEIVAALTDPNTGGEGQGGDATQGGAPNPPAGAPAPSPAPAPEQANSNPVFEEWRVENVKDVQVAFRKEDKEFDDSCFEKVKYLRDTAISKERAELLNSQASNSGIRLYAKK